VEVIERLTQRADEAQARAERLRKMVELARELGDDGLNELAELVVEPKGEGNGNGHSVEPKAPRGRKAIRQVVADRPGLWTLEQIVAELQRREWFTSRKGAEVAVSRMITDGEGRRIRKGQYQFPADVPEAVMFP
jgi:hypothetical protein